MISIAIVNWNSGPLLGRCVSSLAEHASECEIIVVDNASEDGSADFLRASDHSVTLIRNSHNVGFAAAGNLAWQRSRGEWILFLNPDIECLPGSVGRLAEPLIRDTSVWATGGLLVDARHKPQAGYSIRRFPTIGSVAADMLLLDELWPSNPWTMQYRLAHFDPRLAADVCQPAGACLMVSKRALTTMGGFDESFRPAWFEDVDLCRRIWDSGGRIHFVPDAKFLHLGGHTLERLGREKFLKIFHANQIRYFAKHHGANQAESVRRLVVAGLCLRAAVSLLRRSPDGGSRRSASRVFWRVARYFGATGEGIR